MTYIHSGAAGDLIYALPAMRRHSLDHGEEKFNIILGRKIQTHRPWHVINVLNIRPLLEAQPYIAAVTRQEDGSKWDFDCDLWRHHVKVGSKDQVNISTMVARVLNVDPKCSDDPWLTVDVPCHIPDRPVVISRTGRYPNFRFPWNKVMQRYGPHASFVGTQFEWERFCFQHGSLPYCPTANALELARVIAGSRLFVGNQSLCYAIAEGLKQNTVQETSKIFPNCIWRRPGATIFDGQPISLNALTAI